MRQILGKTPMRRGTVQQLPSRFRSYTKHIEQSSLVQKSPLGSYIGIAVVLVPRYRTSNIRVDYVRKPKGAVSGLMSTGTNSRKRG